MIIGLVGHKRSGKTTVANALSEKGFGIYALAGPLKMACMLMFDWDEEHTDGDLKEIIDPRWGISPRQAMQHIGTEWAQFELPKAYPDFGILNGRLFWMHLFHTWYKKNADSWHGIVIPDVRFLHEANYLKENMEARIWKIMRPGCNGDNHASEQEIASIEADLTIVNDSTLDNLTDRVLNKLCGEGS